MRLFSKFSVLHSVLHRNIRNTKYLIASSHINRQYGTIEKNISTGEKREVFLPSQNKTSRIADKVALVAGGSGEIGLMCVRNLLSSGAKAIMIADTDEEEGRNLICELSKEYGGDKTAFIKTDLANIKLLRNAFNWTKKHFKRIDIVVNIAKPVHQDSWQDQLEKNVEGIVRGTLLGIEYMGRHHGADGGCVFNLVASPPTDDADACPVFVGARHFVIGFGRAMSLRCADDTGVKVVTLCADEGGGGGSEGRNRKDTTACDFSNLVLLAKNGSVWTT
ncbi:unnamed protein product [Phaedon cochleariae]|uniref:Uncharacterized protein n=1 Tax=Phaedon cochleariae TaxID=80249 RepID=A0A9P0D8W3_PHACE|nr:unnamed protein product [Phaedon cochleariae]